MFGVTMECSSIDCPFDVLSLSSFLLKMTIGISSLGFDIIVKMALRPWQWEASKWAKHQQYSSNGLIVFTVQHHLLRHFAD